MSVRCMVSPGLPGSRLPRSLKSIVGRCPQGLVENGRDPRHLAPELFATSPAVRPAMVARKIANTRQEGSVRILVTSIPQVSHMFPIVPTAQALQAAGHDWW